MAGRSRTSDRVDRLEGRFDGLEAKVDRGFAAVAERFEQVDKRFEQVDKRLEQVDRRFEQVDRRFDQVDRRFDQERSRSQTLHEELTGHFRHLYDLLKGQSERMDEGFARLDKKIDEKFAIHDAVLKDHSRRLLILEGRRPKA